MFIINLNFLIVLVVKLRLLFLYIFELILYIML
uniref:Uncharacterized protein n=1 Tax=Geladintestivirus 6 TaxID=3233138 RepID=A0AAU8MI33_9CAUD